MITCQPVAYAYCSIFFCIWPLQLIIKTLVSFGNATVQNPKQMKINQSPYSSKNRIEQKEDRQKNKQAIYQTF